MKFPRLCKTMSLITLSLAAIPAATAQTIISNETLMSTTLVVDKHDVTAFCGQSSCSAKTPMFTVPVTCPAAIGQTCTFHISLDAKVSIFSGVNSFYRFLVDGAAPTVGPTGKQGGYLFSQNPALLNNTRQSYPASVVATVTNSTSNSHTIAVSLGCSDNGSQDGCDITAHWSTMRVDVFTP